LLEQRLSELNGFLRVPLHDLLPWNFRLDARTSAFTVAFPLERVTQLTKADCQDFRGTALDRTYQPSTGSHHRAIKNPATGSGEPALSFAGFRLEADGSLFRGESLIHLPPRELAALQLLLANVGQIVTPLQLKNALWGDVHVTADSVPKCLSSLRARLQPEDCIQTVYKRGYRLTAEVRRIETSSADLLPRLAIPPFITESGVPDHLGTALAEETVTRLSNAQSPIAAILARDSVFTLALRGLNAQQIGEALHADLVLAGTLRAYTSHFRLRAEMIRVDDGIQIWVEDLLVERDKVTGLDSELAIRLDFRLKSWPSFSQHQIARNSQQTISPAESEDSATPHTSAPVSLSDRKAGPTDQTLSIAAAAEPSLEAVSHSQRREAYESFLRGHHEWQTDERHRMQDALQLLTNAVELDPSLIAAKVDLSHLCVTQEFYGFMSPAQAANLVRSTAETIPDLSEQAPAILPDLAWIHFHFERDLNIALRYFKLSSDLPHDQWVTRARVMFALSRHRFPEAVALLRAAIDQDPFSPSLHGRLAWALHLGGNAAESIDQIEQCIRLFSDHESTVLYGVPILAFNGHAASGIKLAQKLPQLQPRFDATSAVHAYALACAGRNAEARALLERLNWLSHERFLLSAFTPAVHVALGDLDVALAELKAGNESRCPWFFQMLADPRLKPLHGNSEFKQLQSILTRMEDDAHGSEASTFVH
jgi:DNA-binding winged helix-turn-helix (wHTH) protein/tetratricopeptide (TPR) repeat protein